MISDPAFPRLTAENHEVTSASDVGYNCVAWAAGDATRWWQPGFFWPLDVPRHECGIGALEAVFLELGFEECPDGTREPGFEKVALYGSGLLYTHAARQLPDGSWTSKLGKAQDIRHDSPDDIAGGLYGEVIEFMRRRVS